MFREKMAKMLKLDNPIANVNKKSFDVGQVEDLISSHGGKAEETPDFSKVLKQKGLTKEENHDTISDSDKAEIEALKMLIAKYKSEK